MSLTSANRSLQLLSRLLDTETATEPFFDAGPQKPEIPLGRSTRPLPRCVPERLGVSSKHIADFLRALQQEPSLRMHNILILRHGQVLCRASFGARDTVLPRMTFSACKSITAMAIGILMDDGLLRPEDKLTDLFPDESGPLSRPLMRDLTVHHLLSMQTGNSFNEAASMTREDWIKGYFSSPGLETSRKFQYNSLNTYILAALVTRLSGMSLSEFLTKRLFGPMGISDFYWETSPEGIEKGGWGLYLSPEDLGKLGQLVMDGGMWQGKQLLSAEFLEQATKTHATVPASYGDFNYGWQMWVGRTENTFLFNGMLGQNVLGFRDSGIILVSHAGNDEAFQTSAYYTLAAHFFGGSFPQKLPRNIINEYLLRQTVASLGAPRFPIPTQRQFSLFAGSPYVTAEPHAASAGLLPLLLQTVENCYTKGLRAVTLGGTRSRPELLYEEHDEIHHLQCGVKRPIRQTLNFRGNSFKTAVQARFAHDEDGHPLLRIQIDFLETPCTRILKLIPSGHGLILRQEETPGAGFVSGILPTAASSAAKVLLSSVLGSAEQGYLRWRVERMFTQTLKLEKEA